MVETKRMKMLISIYREDIKYKIYEIYKSFDELERVRTYIILNDGFNTTLKMDELGLNTEETINELENLGYVSIDSAEVKLRLRK